jgi:hypothetical protein
MGVGVTAVKWTRQANQFSPIDGIPTHWQDPTQNDGRRFAVVSVDHRDNVDEHRHRVVCRPGSDLTTNFIPPTLTTYSHPFLRRPRFVGTLVHDVNTAEMLALTPSARTQIHQSAYAHDGLGPKNRAGLITTTEAQTDLPQFNIADPTIP